jgi:hypothetical protein
MERGTGNKGGGMIFLSVILPPLPLLAVAAVFAVGAVVGWWMWKHNGDDDEGNEQ